jgi:hypothetical protein
VRHADPFRGCDEYEAVQYPCRTVHQRAELLPKRQSGAVGAGMDQHIEPITQIQTQDF